MGFHKLLLGMVIIVFFLLQADAEAGDPLDPGQLGESMSMPLSQELIQKAMRAGVIAESNPLRKTDIQEPSFSAAYQPESDAINSIDNVNVTGSWSFDLNGTDPEQMRLDLVQNKDVVMGQGMIIRKNKTENASVSGSLSGDKLSLIVMPLGVLDLYQLNLSLSALSAGTYTAYLADGSSRTGGVTFTASSNIFRPESVDSKEESSSYSTGYVPGDSAGYQTGGPTASVPVQLSGGQGARGRISSKETMSMSSIGGSMGSSSSSISSG